MTVANKIPITDLDCAPPPDPVLDPQLTKLTTHPPTPACCCAAPHATPFRAARCDAYSRSRRSSLARVPMAPALDPSPTSRPPLLSSHHLLHAARKSHPALEIKLNAHHTYA
jgi:hypothetical protein